MSSRAVCGECGWQGKPTTPSRAVYSLRRHSCAKHLELLERRARGEQIRAAAAARMVTRECEHKNARHEHGTHAAYVLDHCRCPDCRAASRVYENHRSRQRGYGIEAYVDAEPARQHLRDLMAQGVGHKRIAKTAGVTPSVVSALLYGKERPNGTKTPIRRIRPATEQAILAVRFTPDLLGAAVLVDGTGTRRRLEALVALGWSRSLLAERLGRTPANFGRTMTAENVTAATERAVRDLYEQMWNTRPPQDTHRQRISVARALNDAKARGWLAPMWWDDDTIDDPAAVPSRSRGRDAVHVEDVDWLLRSGVFGVALAERLGVKVESIETACRRAGRGDLATWARTGEQPATYRGAA